MTSKESEIEALKKLERNRIAFEGWLTKKRHERARKKKMEQTTDDKNEHKHLLAKRAYTGWLRRKQAEDEIAKQQRKIDREMQRLALDKKQADKKRAEESFSAWKSRKDLEMRLERHCNTSDSTFQSSDTTPTLPGYCSVWSCDEQLATAMRNKVPRGEPVILSSNQ